MYRFRPFLRIALLALLLTSCTTVFSGADQKQRQRWQAQQLTNYRYRFNLSCFCDPKLNEPVEIEVRNGKAVRFVYVNTGKRAKPADYAAFDTIDKVFAIIDAANARGADEVSVEYDATFGFPTEIAIDETKEATDDEVAYIVTDFAAITP